MQNTPKTSDNLIIGVSLVVFTDEFGPYLSASTLADFSTEDNMRMSLNFAHKVTLVCSMGDKVGELEKLHGPVDIDMMKPLQECFAYPLLLREEESIDTRILTHGRLSVLTIHYLAEQREAMRALERAIETTMHEITHEMLFDKNINQMTMRFIREDEQKSGLLERIDKELRETLKLMKMREDFGLSIFNLGTLRSLPQPFQPVAYELIFNPEGTTINRLLEKVDLDEENVRQILQTLTKMQYVETLTNEQGTFYKALP
ncbi:MAG: hypothetical protein ACXAB4_11265 [Candidatus Hodarchaeales archaeon]